MPFYEAGTYNDVPITEQGFGTSKDKGTPCFFVRILPGEYPRDITWYLPEGNKAAIDRLMAGLEVLGFDGSDYMELDPNSPKFWDFSQTTITCECRYEAYNGKQVERWQLPFAGVSKEVAPLDSKAIRKLQALYGKELKERFGGKRGASTRAPEPKAPPVTIEQELVDYPPTEDENSVPF